MAEWVDVMAELERHEVIVRDDRSAIVAVRSAGVVIRVRAEEVRAFDEPWLLVIAPICREANANFRDALALNMTLALAALAIEQSWLVLRATQPFATLDGPAITRIFEFVVQEALRLRSIHAPDAAALETALGHYGE